MKELSWSYPLCCVFYFHQMSLNLKYNRKSWRINRLVLGMLYPELFPQHSEKKLLWFFSISKDSSELREHKWLGALISKAKTTFLFIYLFFRKTNDLLKRNNENSVKWPSSKSICVENGTLQSLRWVIHYNTMSAWLIFVQPTKHIGDKYEVSSI